MKPIRTRPGLFALGLLVLSILLILPSTAATLTYSNVSDAYLGSPYYEYLEAVELTGDQRTDLILVALSQLGYHEGNSDADTHGLNTSGSRNYVEYNRMFYPVDNNEGNGYGYGYHWCCAFATWCARQAGISEKIAPGEISCRRLIVDHLRPMGVYHDIDDGTPRAGDFLFFCSESGAISDHIGIVLYVQGSTVHTVEGNTSTRDVAVRSYDLSDAYIVGYASPNYTENKAAAMDFNPATGGYHLYNAAYYITASSLTVRTGAGVENTAVGYLHYGERVSLLEVKDGWGRIDHEGLAGWISLKYAQYTPVPVELPTCTVSFVFGSSVQSHQTLKPGEALTIPVPQARASDQPAVYLWTPIGWDSDGDNRADLFPGESYTVNENVTMTAIYERTPVTYTVRFLDTDGTLLSAQQIAYGSLPVPPDMTGKTSAEGGAFDRWSGAMLAVTEDVDFTAVYEEVVYYTVRFFHRSGELAKEQTLKAGEIPTPPDDSDMLIDDGSVFLGWDGEMLPVSADIDYHPRYEQKLAPDIPPEDEPPISSPPDDNTVDAPDDSDDTLIVIFAAFGVVLLVGALVLTYLLANKRRSA